MDPESPKPEKPGDTDGKSDDSARKRVDSLSSKKRDEKEPGAAGKEDTGKPVLTERQRIEAREARRKKRASPAPQGANPLAKGLKATGFEIRRTAYFLGRSVIAALAALGPVFSKVGVGLVWLLERAGDLFKAVRRLVARAITVLGRVLVSLDRVLTPHRALILVAGLAAIILGVSQFKGLGQIEIGQAGYAGIEDLARAPAMDKTTPAGVHTRIFVPIAALAFVSVLVILLGGIGTQARRFGRFRRLASMTLVMIGLLTLVVALLVDLPDATDTTEAALAYAEVKARLLSGFWLELAAGTTLAVSGLALLLEPGPQRIRESRRQPRDTDSAEDPSEDSAAEPINRPAGSRAQRLNDGPTTMTGSNA